jgi:hypothetical protein
MKSRLGSGKWQTFLQCSFLILEQLLLTLTSTKVVFIRQASNGFSFLYLFQCVTFSIDSYVLVNICKCHINRFVKIFPIGL